MAFVKRLTRIRLTDLSWSIICSIITTLWCIHVIFLEPKCPFLIHPTITSNYEPFSISSRYLHLSHIALYICKIISHVYFEERKPHDHIMLIVHHIVAISLIIFSFVTRCNGQGMSILFLHLSTDLFLYLGRFINTLLPELKANGIKIRPIVYQLTYVNIAFFSTIW